MTHPKLISYSAEEAHERIQKAAGLIHGELVKMGAPGGEYGAHLEAGRLEVTTEVDGVEAFVTARWTPEDNEDHACFSARARLSMNVYGRTRFHTPTPPHRYGPKIGVHGSKIRARAGRADGSIDAQEIAREMLHGIAGDIVRIATWRRMAANQKASDAVLSAFKTECPEYTHAHWSVTEQYPDRISCHLRADYTLDEAKRIYAVLVAIDADRLAAQRTMGDPK